MDQTPDPAASPAVLTPLVAHLQAMIGALDQAAEIVQRLEQARQGLETVENQHRRLAGL